MAVIRSQSPEGSDMEIDLNYAFAHEDDIRAAKDRDPLEKMKVEMTVTDLALIMTLAREKGRENRKERIEAHEVALEGKVTKQ